ncbi:GntR family transcriptional regulator [Oscillospiraceae bacterium WX1]
MEEPLYLKISCTLRKGILAGAYKPGDMLPSENELASRFQTSRVTVRKSLDVLVGEGLIKSWHGKGHFVLQPKYTMFTLFFGDTAPCGRFRFQEVNIIEPDEAIADVLKLKKQQMTIVTRRILEKGGQTIAYDEKFIPYERGTPSIEFEFHFAEFPDMFETRFTPMSIHTEMTIGLETPPPYVCDALGLEGHAPLLVVNRLIRAEDDKPVGFGKQYLTEAYGTLTAKSGYYTSGKL